MYIENLRPCAGGASAGDRTARFIEAPVEVGGRAREPVERDLPHPPIDFLRSIAGLGAAVLGKAPRLLLPQHHRIPRPLAARPRCHFHGTLYHINFRAPGGVRHHRKFRPEIDHIDFGIRDAEADRFRRHTSPQRAMMERGLPR